MDKIAQKRGLLSEIGEKLYFPRYFYERDPDFGNLMDNLRLVDDAVRATASGETIGDALPYGDQISLKDLVDNIDTRDYIKAAINLNKFSDKVKDIVEKLESLNSSFNTSIYSKYLLSGLDPKEVKELGEIGEKFKGKPIAEVSEEGGKATALAAVQRLDAELVKQGGLGDWFRTSIFTERGRALNILETTYPKQIKKIKSDSRAMYNQARSLLRTILTALDNMSTARTLGKPGDYFLQIKRITDQYVKFEASFKKYFDENIKQFLEDQNILNMGQVAPKPEEQVTNANEALREDVRSNYERSSNPVFSWFPKSRQWVINSPNNLNLDTVIQVSFPNSYKLSDEIKNKKYNLTVGEFKFKFKDGSGYVYEIKANSGKLPKFVEQKKSRSELEESKDLSIFNLSEDVVTVDTGVNITQPPAAAPVIAPLAEPVESAEPIAPAPIAPAPAPAPAPVEPVPAPVEPAPAPVEPVPAPASESDLDKLIHGLNQLKNKYSSEDKFNDSDKVEITKELLELLKSSQNDQVKDQIKLIFENIKLDNFDAYFLALDNLILMLNTKQKEMQSPSTAPTAAPTAAPTTAPVTPAARKKTRNQPKKVKTSSSSHHNFLMTLESMSNESPLIVSSYIRKYANKIQHTHPEDALKLMKLIRSLKG